MVEKRIIGKYTWLPPEKRPPRIPGPRPPRKPETRKPLYMVVFDQPDLFFVNLSGKTLTRVSTDNERAFLFDEDTFEFHEAGVADYVYDSVQNQEAVKIEQFELYDYDFHFYLNITVLSPDNEKKTFLVGAKEVVKNDIILLWDNGDIGKKANLISP